MEKEIIKKQNKKNNNKCNDIYGDLYSCSKKEWIWISIRLNREYIFVYIECIYIINDY